MKRKIQILQPLCARCKRHEACDSRKEYECYDFGKTLISCGGYEPKADAADVAEVVRCKDCKYFQDNNYGYLHEGCRWRDDETPDGDDFCSCGERKENE